ncbi:PREDICTED: hexosaminidase D isoform X5 [Hipposideros armiger]|uniref:Hexosaminidase D isoform X5 n=1 Tax=Hipposideros armiger TaxID=186990 RepID=A0A8B7SZ78_HIPAR|nr:PREDICTED: hexosaminidase D isoform X5 [Hipposideros armiger]
MRGRSAWSSHSPGQAHLVLGCPVSPTLLQGSGVLTAATTHVWPLGFWLGLIRIKSVSSVSPLPLGLAPQHSLQTARSALKGSSGFALHRTPGVWSFPWLAGFVAVALPPNSTVLTLYLKLLVLEKMACVPILCKKCGLRAVSRRSPHSWPVSAPSIGGAAAGGAHALGLHGQPGRPRQGPPHGKVSEVWFSAALGCQCLQGGHGGEPGTDAYRAPSQKPHAVAASGGLRARRRAAGHCPDWLAEEALLKTLKQEWRTSSEFRAWKSPVSAATGLPPSLAATSWPSSHKSAFTYVAPWMRCCTRTVSWPGGAPSLGSWKPPCVASSTRTLWKSGWRRTCSPVCGSCSSCCRTSARRPGPGPYWPARARTQVRTPERRGPATPSSSPVGPDSRMAMQETAPTGHAVIMGKRKVETTEGNTCGALFTGLQRTLMLLK